MSYRVTLSLPDVEGDNPVQAVEAFAEAARGWEQWEYSVIDEDTGLRYHVDMQSADEGGIIYPTLTEGGVRHPVEPECLNTD